MSFQDRTICLRTGRQTPASHDDWDTGWFARFPLSVEFQEGAFVNADDKKYWVSQFSQSGFKHPVDYYRNVDANWRDFAADPSMLGRKIEQPTSFICQCPPPLVLPRLRVLPYVYMTCILRPVAADRWSG